MEDNRIVDFEEGSKGTSISPETLKIKSLPLLKLVRGKALNVIPTYSS